MNTETHPIIAGFVVEYRCSWEHDWSLATIVKAIPSRGRLDRIFGARLTYIIQPALDTGTIAVPAEWIRSI